ncbi:MAG: uroporphyrinogen-III C-methyltransferase [Acidobacteriota bacterium]|nr:uroporphyrinogen-III C-methyltransferase [Acidobacteriota bacterium]
MTSYGPRVYIVGAGPGDPSLISLRGYRCLTRADVVIYDHRVQARLLRWAPATAERIDVGPSSRKPLEQDAVALLVAEKAREGLSVVRLKWGDPFVFDTGGKEALLLREHGIDFEIIPGIPAAIAAPAYAGIPVTYPAAGDTLVIIRGAETATTEPPDVDWAALAKMDGSMVCYAGPRQLPSIAKALISHGRAADETAVLIRSGTLPTQQTTVTTLGALALAVDERRTSLLIVGAAAELREHLRWFDRRPLFGKRIIVTRSREQARELMERIEDAGAEAIAAPTVTIEPPDDDTPMGDAVDAASSFEWIVFTSATAVDRFLGILLSSHRDIRTLHGVKLCAIGPSTAERLAAFGIKADLSPAEFGVEAVADALEASKGKRLLIVRPDHVRDVLATELQARGAHVTDVVAYRTVPAADTGQDLYRMLLDGKVDAVTFTSASTVRQFVDLLGRDQAVDLLSTTVVAAIGPVTAEAATQLGLTVQVVPERYDVESLVGAIVTHFQADSPNP